MWNSIQDLQDAKLQIGSQSRELNLSPLEKSDQVLILGTQHRALSISLTWCEG